MDYSVGSLVELALVADSVLQFDWLLNATLELVVGSLELEELDLLDS